MLKLEKWCLVEVLTALTIKRLDCESVVFHIINFKVQKIVYDEKEKYKYFYHQVFRFKDNFLRIYFSIQRGLSRNVPFYLYFPSIRLL